MKDLTDKHLYDLEKYDFDKELKRIIKSSEYSQKMEEIDEYLREQELKKGEKTVTLGVDNYQTIDELQREQSFESLNNRFNNIKQTEYESLVEMIRKAIDPKRKRTKQSSSQNFGINSNMSNDYVDEVSPSMYWKEFYSWGKELSYLEDVDPIKEESNSRGRMGRFGGGFGSRNNNDDKKETQKQKDKRLIYENWIPWLETGKVSFIFIVFNLIFTFLKINPLGANPLWLLIASIIIFLGVNIKLFTTYNDGLLNKNFLLKDINAELFLKDKFEIKKKSKENIEENESDEENNSEINEREQRMNQNRRNRSHFDNFNSNRFDESNEEKTSSDSNDIFDLDDDSDDDFDSDLFDDDSDDLFDEEEKDLFEDDEKEIDSESPEDNISNENSNNDVLNLNDLESTNNNKFNKKMIDIVQEQKEGRQLPEALGVASSEKDLFDLEEYFIKYTYENRDKLKLRTPKEILNYFAPLIVNFNTNFANTNIVDRDSDLFKNISYSLLKYYFNLDSSFKSTTQYNKNYYCIIDDIYETALYYKIRIVLPSVIKEDKFKEDISKFTNILKDGTDDPCSVILEMNGREGFIKILKLNKYGFLPLVSTGDVMRFDGIKTTTGKDLYSEITKPGSDAQILFGLQNSERAFVYDIGSNQNSNLAIVGFTGSGKSVSSGGWFDFLTVTHSPDDIGFIILDPKDGTTWSAFRYMPHVLGYFGANDFKEWPNITNLLRNICTERQNYFKELRTGKANFNEARKMYSKNDDYEKLIKVPRLIVIYDELFATVGSLKTIDTENKVYNQKLSKGEKELTRNVSNLDGFKAGLAGLSNVTREAGVTIVGLSQRSTDDAFPKGFLSSCSMQFGMKMKEPKDGARLWSCKDKDVPDVVSLPTGTGYFSGNNQQLTQVQTPLFSGDPDLNDELTKTIGLCWQIIYSNENDVTKLPEEFCLDSAQLENIGAGTNFDNGACLFNRDKFFKEVVVKDLKEGQVHFKHCDTDISIDLSNSFKENVKPQPINDNMNQENQEKEQIQYEEKHEEKPKSDLLFDTHKKEKRRRRVISSRKSLFDDVKVNVQDENEEMDEKEIKISNPKVRGGKIYTEREIEENPYLEVINLFIKENKTTLETSFVQDSFTNKLINICIQRNLLRLSIDMKYLQLQVDNLPISN